MAALITLPPQTYIEHHPHFITSGECTACDSPIYGDRFVCPKGEFCIDCAAEKGFVCGECWNEMEECHCGEAA